MPSMPLRSFPNRHYYDRNPTPEHPAVRLYPELHWRMPPSAPAVWVRDDGQDLMDRNIVGPFNRGKSHYAELIDRAQECDVCKRRKSFRYDDFFGYLCTTCEITHALRYKARGVNPWGGKVMT